MTQVISTTVSPEFYQLAKENHIKWSEALRVGISMILADLGVREYDNNLSLFRKMRGYQKLAEESLKKLEELKKPTKEEEQEAASKAGL